MWIHDDKSKVSHGDDFLTLEDLIAGISKLKTKLTGRLGQDNTQKDPVTNPVQSRLLLGFAGLLGVFVLFVGSMYAFSGGSWAPIYLGSTKIEATESHQSITNKLNEQIKNYKFTIVYPDKTQKSFFIADAGLKLAEEKTTQQTNEALKTSFIDRMKWWGEIRLPVALDKDKAKYKQFIDTHGSVTKTIHQDAKIEIVDGNVVVTPEVTGEGYVARDLLEKLEAMSSQPVTLVAAKLKPALYSKDTDKAKASIEKLLAQPVVLTIAGDTYQVSRKTIGGWIDVAPVPENRVINVGVNNSKVLEYIRGIAEDYTSPVSNRTVINTGSGQVVVDPGSDGSDVINKDEVASLITDKLTKNQPVNEKLEVSYVKAKTTSLPAHSKWILANVTTKRMYAYEGGNLVKSFLISAGAPDTPTVLGRYKVYAKYRSQDMRGLNTDGSRYFQPDVPYVLYFTGGYAIHGNYWRPASWFGNVNSSHGCLGVTVGDGAWIYNWAPIGTPVITQS